MAYFVIHRFTGVGVGLCEEDESCTWPGVTCIRDEDKAVSSGFGTRGFHWEQPADNSKHKDDAGLAETSLACEKYPCPAPLLGAIGTTTVSGSMRGVGFPAGEDIFGPFEAGFSASQGEILRGLGCPPGHGYLQGGIDTHSAERAVAHRCGITLPRYDDDGKYISFLDECGGHSREYHFHERMSCLYSNTCAGHSQRIGTALDGHGIYGKWEDCSNMQLPELDACGGSFGVTPDSSGAVVYHYHVQDTPPFTVGCFGPAFTSNGVAQPVTVEQCRALYDGCGDGDDIELRWGPESGNASWYDPWCPCFDDKGSNIQPSSKPSGLSKHAAAAAKDATEPEGTHSCYLAKEAGRCELEAVQKACPVSCDETVGSTGAGDCVCDLSARPDGSLPRCADYAYKCTGTSTNVSTPCWGARMLKDLLNALYEIPAGCYPTPVSSLEFGTLSGRFSAALTLESRNGLSHQVDYYVSWSIVVGGDVNGRGVISSNDPLFAGNSMNGQVIAVDWEGTAPITSTSTTYTMTAGAQFCSAFDEAACQAMEGPEFGKRYCNFRGVAQATNPDLCPSGCNLTNPAPGYEDVPGYEVTFCTDPLLRAPNNHPGPVRQARDPAAPYQTGGFGGTEITMHSCGNDGFAFLAGEDHGCVFQPPAAPAAVSALNLEGPVTPAGTGLCTSTVPSTCADPGGDGSVCLMGSAASGACPPGCSRGVPVGCNGTATCALGAGGLVADCDTASGCVYTGPAVVIGISPQALTRADAVPEHHLEWGPDHVYLIIADPSASDFMPGDSVVVTSAGIGNATCTMLGAHTVVAMDTNGPPDHWTTGMLVSTTTASLVDGFNATTDCQVERVASVVCPGLGDAACQAEPLCNHHPGTPAGTIELTQDFFTVAKLCTQFPLLEKLSMNGETVDCNCGAGNPSNPTGWCPAKQVVLGGPTCSGNVDPGDDYDCTKAKCSGTATNSSSPCKFSLFALLRGVLGPSNCAPGCDYAPRLRAKPGANTIMSSPTDSMEQRSKTCCKIDCKSSPTAAECVARSPIHQDLKQSGCAGPVKACEKGDCMEIVFETLLSIVPVCKTEDIYISEVNSMGDKLQFLGHQDYSMLFNRGSRWCNLDGYTMLSFDNGVPVGNLTFSVDDRIAAKSTAIVIGHNVYSYFGNEWIEPKDAVDTQMDIGGEVHLCDPQGVCKIVTETPELSPCVDMSWSDLLSGAQIGIVYDCGSLATAPTAPTCASSGTNDQNQWISANEACCSCGGGITWRSQQQPAYPAACFDEHGQQSCWCGQEWSTEKELHSGVCIEDWDTTFQVCPAWAAYILSAGCKSVDTCSRDPTPVEMAAMRSEFYGNTTSCAADYIAQTVLAPGLEPGGAFGVQTKKEENDEGPPPYTCCDPDGSCVDGDAKWCSDKTGELHCSVFAPKRNTGRIHHVHSPAPVSTGSGSNSPGSGSNSCADGVMNNGETGIDCGGPCPACGGSCSSNHECDYAGCSSGLSGETYLRYGCDGDSQCFFEVRDFACDGLAHGEGSCFGDDHPDFPITNGGRRTVCAQRPAPGGGGSGCSHPNGYMDNGETGVDCGGACPACSGPTTCNLNNMQDSDEAGVDCGGSVCPACWITSPEGIYITEVANAGTGNHLSDRCNGGPWIELYNLGMTVTWSPQLLQNWSLTTNTGMFYSFPDGTVIGPKEYLILCLPSGLQGAGVDAFQAHDSLELHSPTNGLAQQTIYLPDLMVGYTWSLQGNGQWNFRDGSTPGEQLMCAPGYNWCRGVAGSTCDCDVNSCECDDACVANGAFADSSPEPGYLAWLGCSYSGYQISQTEVPQDANGTTFASLMLALGVVPLNTCEEAAAADMCVDADEQLHAFDNDAAFMNYNMQDQGLLINCSHGADSLSNGQGRNFCIDQNNQSRLEPWAALYCPATCGLYGDALIYDWSIDNDAVATALFQPGPGSIVDEYGNPSINWRLTDDINNAVYYTASTCVEMWSRGNYDGDSWWECSNPDFALLCPQTCACCNDWTLENAADRGQYPTGIWIVSDDDAALAAFVQESLSQTDRAALQAMAGITEDVSFGTWASDLVAGGLMLNSATQLNTTAWTTCAEAANDLPDLSGSGCTAHPWIPLLCPRACQTAVNDPGSIEPSLVSLDHLPVGTETSLDGYVDGSGNAGGWFDCNAFAGSGHCMDDRYAYIPRFCPSMCTAEWINSPDPIYRHFRGNEPQFGTWVSYLCPRSCPQFSTQTLYDFYDYTVDNDAAAAGGPPVLGWTSCANGPTRGGCGDTAAFAAMCPETCARLLSLVPVDYDAVVLEFLDWGTCASVSEDQCSNDFASHLIRTFCPASCAQYGDVEVYDWTRDNDAVAFIIDDGMTAEPTCSGLWNANEGGAHLYRCDMLLFAAACPQTCSGCCTDWGQMDHDMPSEPNGTCHHSHCDGGTVMGSAMADDDAALAALVEQSVSPTDQTLPAGTSFGTWASDLLAAGLMAPQWNTCAEAANDPLTAGCAAHPWIQMLCPRACPHFGCFAWDSSDIHSLSGLTDRDTCEQMGGASWLPYGHGGMIVHIVRDQSGTISMGYVDSNGTPLWSVDSNTAPWFDCNAFAGTGHCTDDQYAYVPRFCPEMCANEWLQSADGGRRRLSESSPDQSQECGACHDGCACDADAGDTGCAGCHDSCDQGVCIQGGGGGDAPSDAEPLDSLCPLDFNPLAGRGKVSPELRQLEQCLLKDARKQAPRPTNSTPGLTHLLPPGHHVMPDGRVMADADHVGGNPPVHATPGSVCCSLGSDPASNVYVTSSSGCLRGEWTKGQTAADPTWTFGFQNATFNAPWLGWRPDLHGGSWQASIGSAYISCDWSLATAGDYGSDATHGAGCREGNMPPPTGTPGSCTRWQLQLGSSVAVLPADFSVSPCRAC